MVPDKAYIRDKVSVASSHMAPSKRNLVSSVGIKTNAEKLAPNRMPHGWVPFIV